MAGPLSVRAVGAARVDRFDLGLDISVEPGGRLAIMGPNGAGKTTTLRVVAGLTPLDGGSVLLGDRVVDDPAAGVFVAPEHRDIGYVFQEGRIFERLSVGENIGFGLRCRRLPDATVRERTSDWLTRIGLAHRESSRPAELSGGQMRRVALARAMAFEPGLLLLDEPFVGLDDESTEVLWSVIDQVAATVIVVTHDPPDAERLGGARVRLDIDPPPLPAT